MQRSFERSVRWRCALALAARARAPGARADRRDRSRQSGAEHHPGRRTWSSRLRNQVQQIEQAAAMLRQNPLQLSPELSQSIGEARALFETRRRASPSRPNQLGEDLRTLYPETWEDFDLDDVLAAVGPLDARKPRTAFERAMEAEARAAQSIEQTRGRIDRALQSSIGAEGQTGAIQAGNQLLGIQAVQLAEIHALLIAQGRALETERMERLAREERAARNPAPRFPDRTRAGA